MNDRSPVLWEYIDGAWIWAQRINGEVFVGVSAEPAPE
jgi:hypothetical protein